LPATRIFWGKKKGAIAIYLQQQNEMLDESASTCGPMTGTPRSPTFSTGCRNDAQDDREAEDIQEIAVLRLIF
jgi:hypothetical protein